MCVCNFHKVSLLLLTLLFLATGVFAAAEKVECIPYKAGETDGRCLYYRIGDARVAKLYVVGEGKDPYDINNAEPNADFNIYAPQAGSKGLATFLESDKSVVENNTMVNSGSTGIARVVVRGDYPIENVHMGVYTTGHVDPGVSLVYNFYAPELKYFVDNKEVTDKSVFTPEVGDTVHVDVKLFVPDGFGPKGGQIDSISKPFYFTTPGDSKNLKFLKTSGDPLLADSSHPGHLRVDFVKGEAAFLIVATKSYDGTDHFSLGSFDNSFDDDKEFIVDEKFPGTLEFTDRDLPSISDAAIFDNDGDGIGDSIRIWMKGNMNSVTADTFRYSWPSDGKMKEYGGRVPDNKGKAEFVLPDVKTTLQDPDGAEGSVEAVVCSSLGGKRCSTVKSDLKDSIGAVIQSVTIFKGNADADKDTLVVRFNKNVDETWTQGQGLLHLGSDDMVALDVKAIKKNKNVWTFIVDAGEVDVGDSIKINTKCKSDDGVITAADGIPTAANNQKVRVENSGRFYVDNEKNGFYDRDGDGRMDRATLAFDTPVTREILESGDLKITFYWLDEDNKVLVLEPSADQLTISDDGLIVTYDLKPEKQGVQKMLTDIDSAYHKSPEYGYAKVQNKITVDGEEREEVTYCSMNDYMPPVISKTFLKPESFQYMEADKFTISFTEPIDTKSFKLTEDCLAFLVDGQWVNYSFESAEWSNGNRTLTVRMETGVSLTERMNPADSVRFDNFTSGICDKKGNNVSDLSPAVMVMGDPRVITETASYADLNLAAELSGRVKPFTSDTIKGTFDKKEMSSLGVLLDVGFATIMKKDTAGGSVPDLEKIGLVYELDVYTNLGGYVGGASEKILCNDEYFFDGNCLENPEKIYVRWNMRADNGRKVGVGVYLAKFKVKVFGAQSDFKIERIYRWGITASKR